MTDTTYMILYSANLAFIVTHLYGWLLKWFYRPEAYREHFHELFPAQRAVGIIYLLQIFELPYLLQIGDSDALLYVNAFSLLCFSIQMLIMCEGYFFPEIKHRLKGYWLFIPAVIVLLPMFLQAVNLIDLPEGWRVWAVGAVSLLFISYFSLSVRMALRIRNAVRRANEDQYADSDARCVVETHGRASLRFPSIEFLSFLRKNPFPLVEFSIRGKFVYIIYGIFAIAKFGLLCQRN